MPHEHAEHAAHQFDSAAQATEWDARYTEREAAMWSGRPGGLLLAVYHDLDDEHREHMKAKGIDPSDYVGVDDLVQLLDPQFSIESHLVVPRLDPPPGTAHISDVVLRARRQ